ncbi:MAG: hypothetical protein Q9217_003843 [Psora testacea]
MEMMLLTKSQDEVFHIRQAQAYVQGKWHVWDPKITTPPGLYLVSWVQMQFAGLVGYGKLDARRYRIINQLAVFFLAWILQQLIAYISGIRASKPTTSKDKSGTTKQPLSYLAHTTVNVLLFPLLFFFYGLYYTDTLSVLSVLLTYYFHLQGKQKSLVVSGLASLLFRQTNVFWVVVYLAGLQMQRVLPRGKPSIEFPSQPTIRDIIEGSWTHSCTFDPFVDESGVEDYFKTAISFVVAIVTNLTTVLWALSPYAVILLVFIEFTFWNGGVVLGDKSNHVATIHLAQMLYLWPYLVFFSFPFICPSLLDATIPPQYLPSFLCKSTSETRQTRLMIPITFMALMLAVVHYNTIVHPFTLADNRHYMFYVFKLLRTHSTLKYFAVPIYFSCAWGSLVAVAGPIRSGTKANSYAHPITPKRTKPSTGDATGEEGQRASWLLIWLATTTISLSTAPLVEPRYCILPWLIWRMHLPTLGPRASYELWLETLWFLLINAVTGYMFLYRGFEWKQEPGEVQRFMW